MLQNISSLHLFYFFNSSLALGGKKGLSHLVYCNSGSEAFLLKVCCDKIF